MAKNRSIFQLDGKLGEIVFVNSRYGKHVRAARGTYKPATINQTLKANAQRSAIVNQLASPLYRLLCNCAGGCKDGGAWARILSRFMSAASNDPAELLPLLKGLNMHEGYPMSAVWMIPYAEVIVTSKQLLVAMGGSTPPRFSVQLRKADAWRYQLTAFFLPDTKSDWFTDAAYTEWFDFHEKDTMYDFSFNRPKGRGVYVLCVKLEAGWEGRRLNNREAERVVVMGAGVY